MMQTYILSPIVSKLLARVGHIFALDREYDLLNVEL